MKRRRWFLGLGILALVAILGSLAPWWLSWPESTMDRWIDAVSTGDYSAANSVQSSSFEWRIPQEGFVALKGVEKDMWQRTKVWPELLKARTNIPRTPADYIAGRQRWIVVVLPELSMGFGRIDLETHRITVTVTRGKIEMEVSSEPYPIDVSGQSGGSGVVW